MGFIEQIDVEILLWIQEHLRFDAATVFWRIVTFLGNGGWFWIVLGILLLFFTKTRDAGMTALLSLVFGALITNLLLKNMVARIRPYDLYESVHPLIAHPRDWSFPSGHTCASFASALIYLRMLPKKYGVPLLVLAGLIACSRLYLGVHYPTDVLGGILAAVLASWMACRTMEYVRVKRK